MERIEIVNENDIKTLIYEIRGQKVMLDFDLARIYGYSTKAFNQQIKNNIEKFPGDFMFKLNKEESDFFVRSKKSTPRIWIVGNKGGRTYYPYAFTEQGIYMIMTVLKGEKAIQQSIALIRLFKSMKDYINESNSLLMNTNSYIESKFSSYDKRFEIVESKLESVMDNFNDPSSYKHFLLMNGERIEADIVYRSIYSLAKQSIVIIDDYINVKTLNNLKSCSKEVQIVICSDNVSKDKITDGDINDFILDTGINIKLIPSNQLFHDRSIAIDFKSDHEKLYHSGPSSKDAGNRVATIVEIEHPYLYHELIGKILSN